MLTCWHLRSDKPVQVIGEEGLIFDKPGFEVDFLTASAAGPVSARPHYTVLMPVKGYWRLCQNGQDSHIGPGDTAFLQPDTGYKLAPAMSGEALYTALKILMTPPDQAGGKELK